MRRVLPRCWTRHSAGAACRADGTVIPGAGQAHSTCLILEEPSPVSAVGAEGAHRWKAAGGLLPQGPETVEELTWGPPQ